MFFFQAAAVLRRALVAILVALACAAPAHALIVTVGLTDYDVVLLPGGESFLDNQALLSDPNSAPWFGSLAVATDFANAYQAQQGIAPFDVTPGTGNDGIFFAYSNTMNLVFYLDSDLVGSGSFAPTYSNPTGYYAYVMVSVPEIDGNALAKALFILFALGVWLDVRRRKVARGDA